MPKLWYNRILTVVLVGFLSISLPAQTLPPQLSEGEQLRLQVIQLQAELAQERALKLSVTSAYAQCVQAKYQVDLSTFQMENGKAMHEWVQSVETNHPGFTWDRTKNQLVEIPK